MRVRLSLGIALLLSLVGSRGFGACEMLPGMPPKVPSMLEAWLAPERYTELAKQWDAYVTEHSDLAIGYVYLWRARCRAASNGFQDGARLLGKARELDPNCPLVLSELSHFLMNTGHREEALPLAQRAVELAPDWYEPHFRLLWYAIFEGHSDDVRQELQALVREGGFPSPLLDYAYNMLASVEENAILFTNGDNDSAPVWALQAVFGVRSDVRVVDLSLLSLPRYTKAVLATADARLAPFTSSEIDVLQAASRAAHNSPFVAVLADLSQRVGRGAWKLPVYIATTVPRASIAEACSQPLEIVGLVYRVVPGPAAPAGRDFAVAGAKTDSLLGRVYRLQSATDFGYAWGAESPISGLMMNYVGAYMTVAREYAAAGDLDGVRRMLRGAVTLLRFHPELRQRDGRDFLAEFLDYWKQVDPANPEVDELRREIKG